jgi:hypothetical protein
MLDVMVDGAVHEQLHVDGGASAQTFLCPAALKIGRIAAEAPRPRIAYIVRDRRLKQGWAEVEQSTRSVANRAVATLTTSNGLGDLYRLMRWQSAMGSAFASFHRQCLRRATSRRIRPRIHGEHI